jgi:hypothetical protein
MAPWLVTWEASKTELLPPKRVAAVLHGRTSPDQVLQVVDALYAAQQYTEAELIAFRTQVRNPYPAEFVQMNGVRFRGRITCGHNPYLLARLVDNLRVTAGGAIAWRDRALPHITHTGSRRA